MPLGPLGVACDCAPVTPDVLVIGGGAIGTATALELAGRGATVTLLERGPELASGCSAGNAGLICPSHSAPLSNPAAVRNGLRWMLKRDSPFALKPRPAALPWLARFLLAARRAEAGAQVIRALAVASLELHAELAQRVDTGFERRGVLNVYASDETFAAGKREASHSGLRFEALDSKQAFALEPALGPQTRGVVYYPDEAHCDPLRFVQAVGHEAAAQQVDIRTGTEARLRRTNGTVVVETREGDLSPRYVVLAAGAWAGRLARTIGVFLPLEGGKGYHVDLEAADGDPRVPTWLQESWVIATPLPGRLRLAGTLQLAGLDSGIDHVRADAVRRGGVRSLTGLESRRVVDVWAGLRPCTPDGLPVIGQPPDLDGLIVATGHAMKGTSLAPVTARLVAELVAGETPSHDLEPLSPGRFAPLFPRRGR
jgi:D-amino-acid dehydrogenase